MSIEQDIKDIKQALSNLPTVAPTISMVKSPGLEADERMLAVEKTLADLQLQISKIDKRVTTIENNLDNVGRAAERLCAVLQRYGLCRII